MPEGTIDETKEQHGDLEILEYVKNKLFTDFKSNETNVKAGDLLKVIEMKNKLSVTGKSEKKFWEMINKIREEELTDKKRKSPRKSKKAK